MAILTEKGASGKKAPRECSRDHRFHVAEVVICAREGIATVIRVCLECPLMVADTVKVSERGSELQLGSFEKE